MSTLFDTYMLGGKRVLGNRIVIAPMTRTRTSSEGVPNALMVTYYAQRASAGLIVTEATDVSVRSKGYAWTPGIHTDAQTDGWRCITNEVHRAGGTIFLQVWHVGRMSHTSMMPDGEAPWGVTSAPAAQSDVFAHDDEGKLTFVRASTPRQISTTEAASLVDEFTLAFRNAKRAGFDGVEVHGANGYLFDQFMNSVLNTRTDIYGGQTPESRTRLLLDVVDAAIRELGADKVGVRVSPFGKFNSMPADPRTVETLLYLCDELNRRGVGYLHVVYQSLPAGNVEDGDFNEADLSGEVVWTVRKAFGGTLVWCGGFTRDSAQAAIDAGWADMIAFGRPFIGNPDLAERLKHDRPLVDADRGAYYTRSGAAGFTDYPRFDQHS
jgi:N-ethylmaleimide reductase